VSLSKLYNLKHVNALQPGETLTFQKSGLTVIYGDNGAGKSGYARVLKQACRARLPKDDIVLPAVNLESAAAPCFHTTDWFCPLTRKPTSACGVPRCE
jgi:ABC-type enterochelin transport system ATPase subunit